LRRPHLIRSAAMTLAVTLTLNSVGCDYGADDTSALPQDTLTNAPPPPASAPGGAPLGPMAPADEFPSTPAEGERALERAAILDSVIKQIQSAALNPGGNNFGNATKNLNQYFAGTKPSEYALPIRAREFLGSQLPPDRVNELEQSAWSMPDARHLEDCMLYHGIAARVGGAGDDLTRARRVFDWMVGQVQLVPASSLSGPGLPQAQARPYDVLLRGLATEAEGVWSERGWLFLSLCRQLGLDCGLVTYSPPGVAKPVVWCVAVLVDGKAYLFDQRVGLAIPDAKGDGVATLDEALNDPAVLDRMDLPGQSAYHTDRAMLRASTTKIGILLDSGLRYFSPRMKLLQESLAGKNLTVLFRDPADQREKFAAALGDRLGSVTLWELPMLVEALLFTSPQFVQSTQASLLLFRPEFPLLSARMKQLRGETAEAVQDYVAFRFATNGTLTDKKTPLPKEFQQALDVYATYFLGTCHLDLHEPKQAEFFFDKTLGMLPDPGPQRPYYNMFRWGAGANLGRLREAAGDPTRAIAYDCLNDPTAQRHGNLLRARDLVWRDPTSALPGEIPPAPPAVAPAAAAAMAPLDRASR